MNETVPEFLSVAVNTPLERYFDYLPPRGCGYGTLQPGIRVRVPFGRSRSVVGVLVAVNSHTSVPAAKLRRAIEVLDGEPLLDASLMRLLGWAAAYYRHGPGEVFAAALPAALRAGRALRDDPGVWVATPEGRQLDLEALARRAPRQAALLNALRGSAGGLSSEALGEQGGDWRRALKILRENEFVAEQAIEAPDIPPADMVVERGPDLTDHQALAVREMIDAIGGFNAFLLHGVTGSGKTEVYQRVIEQVLKAGRQTLVLVPEIGLTPQLVDRFRRRFATPVAVMHSGLNETARLRAWRDARDGVAGIVLGTRSAIFTPLRSPGLIVVDEEHDTSFKQQDGFRYSARDLAVLRARYLDVPVVLGSATPALETLQNSVAGRYRELSLPERPGASREPTLRLIDLRKTPAYDGLSPAMLDAMRRHLDDGGQVLVFLNRRGYSPAWFCPACAWIAECRRCDARLTFHREIRRLRCHHCASDRPLDPLCPECGEACAPVGEGTERVEQALGRCFPDTPMARIDRDTTRKRGRMEVLLADTQRGDTRILVGTQMLTKGHHFPQVSLVCVLNADQGLFGTDFRSDERLAQLIVQVAGRAGRAERAGEVLIQTSCPDHPLLKQLIEQGYAGFARAALAERRDAGWPPFSALAMLRAEAADRAHPMEFLEAAAQAARERGGQAVRVLGPAPAPMERRAGRYRAQLLLQAERRGELQTMLAGWTSGLERLPQARRVRWSLDVDPAELY